MPSLILRSGNERHAEVTVTESLPVRRMPVTSVRTLDIMPKSYPDPFTAFANAARKCFVEPCRADTLYVLMIEDYELTTCGRHLTNGVEALKRMDVNRPALRMTLYAKP